MRPKTSLKRDIADGRGSSPGQKSQLCVCLSALAVSMLGRIKPLFENFEAGIERTQRVVRSSRGCWLLKPSAVVDSELFECA